MSLNIKDISELRIFNINYQELQKKVKLNMKCWNNEETAGIMSYKSKINILF